MPKPRGRSHTTLTDTAKEVVDALMKCKGIKMIAPGIIDAGRTGAKRHVTVVFTTAGFELIITGAGVQKVAIHTTGDAHAVYECLKANKRLTHFTFRAREKKPGV